MAAVDLSPRSGHGQATKALITVAISQQLGYPIPPKSNGPNVSVGEPYLVAVEGSHHSLGHDFGDHRVHAEAGAIRALSDRQGEITQAGESDQSPTLQHRDRTRDEAMASLHSKLNLSPPLQRVVSLSPARYVNLAVAYERALRYAHLAEPGQLGDRVQDARRVLFDDDEGFVRSALYQRYQDSEEELGAVEREQVLGALRVLEASSDGLTYEDERSEFLASFESYQNLVLMTDSTYYQAVSATPLPSLFGDRHGWTTVDLDWRAIRNSANTAAELGGLAAEQVRDLVAVSFEYCEIHLHRRWLLIEEFLNQGFWRLPDDQQPLSNGMGGGRAPTVASSLVFVRHCRFERVARPTTMGETRSSAPAIAARADYDRSAQDTVPDLGPVTAVKLGPLYDMGRIESATSSVKLTLSHPQCCSVDLALTAGGKVVQTRELELGAGPKAAVGVPIPHAVEIRSDDASKLLAVTKVNEATLTVRRRSDGAALSNWRFSLGDQPIAENLSFDPPLEEVELVPPFKTDQAPPLVLTHYGFTVLPECPNPDASLWS